MGKAHFLRILLCFVIVYLPCNLTPFEEPNVGGFSCVSASLYAHPKCL